MNLLYYVFPFLTALNSTEIVMNKTTMMHQLHQYGYLDNMNANETEMKESLTEFQYFTNLHPTGQFDNETIQMIHKPRCGRPDKESYSQRTKRYIFARNGPASKSSLSYKIRSYTSNLRSSEVDEIFAQAFQLWSEHSALKFHATNAESDIEISFEPIDGRGRTYGIALDPSYRNIILDNDEVWTKKESHGLNLLQIATHEFGHALGLGHSDKSNSVMFPFYLNYKSNFALDIDDIKGIKALYKNFLRSDENMKGNASLICSDPRIDAIFNAPDGYVYIFKNDTYWKLSSELKMVDGPNLIKDRWKELPNEIDAAFTAWNNVTYFFKSNIVWKYFFNEKYGNSKLISRAFEKIPEDLDAAFIWSGNGCLYFFKGTKFWMFDAFKPQGMRVRNFFPLPIKYWKGVPNNIDDAVSINGVTYFFKGDFYYKYNDKYSLVEDGYPKSLKYEIFGCKL